MTIKTSQHPSQRTSEKGFSLIEVAFALIIIGIFVGTAVGAYNTYMVRKRDIDTKAHIVTVEAALAKYVVKHARYPLPAQRNVGIGQAGFGRSVAAVAPACTITSTTACTTGGANPIYIGDVPFATLGIHYSNAMDMYGNKLTYAITGALTVAPMSDSGGRIQVRYVNGATEMTDAHYFVFSPGPDKQGGFSPLGTLAVPCGVAAVNGTDVENCNNDNIFRSNVNNLPLTYGADTEGKIVRFYRPGATQFDDWGGYKKSLKLGLWALVPGPGELVNTNSSLNVLVGETPFYDDTSGCTYSPGNTAKLCANIPKTSVEVQGRVKADKIRTMRICGDNPGCTTAFTYNDRPRGVFTIGNFAPVAPAPSTGGADDGTTKGQVGGGILCAKYKAMRGFGNGDEWCSDTATVNNPTNYGTCASGTWPTGIDATGHVVCN